MDKKQYFFVMLFLVIALGTFTKLFDDPFHEKTEKVCFWEWIGKEVYELIFGEKEAS